MRLVIQAEVASLICDNCRQKTEEFDATVKFNFGYNSQHDMKYLDFDLCPKCAELFWIRFKEMYQVELKERD